MIILFLISLFASISKQGYIDVPEGTYEKVEFKVNLAPVSSQAALKLNGTFNNGVDSTAVKENGTIVISTASNTNLYNLIWNNLQGMLKVEI